MHLQANECKILIAPIACRAGSSCGWDLLCKQIPEGTIWQRELSERQGQSNAMAGGNSNRKARGTVDGERHLPFPRADPWDHGSTHVFPSVFLADGLQGQLVLVA